jgi:hypothetical protein
VLFMVLVYPFEGELCTELLQLFADEAGPFGPAILALVTRLG